MNTGRISAKIGSRAMDSLHKGLRASVRPGLCAMTLVLTCIAAGCVTPPHRVVVNEIPPCVAQRVTEHFPTSLYRLATGDVLEVLYLTIPTVTSQPYRVDVRDQLDIEFSFAPEMNRTVRVRPDGRISIPRKNDAKVAGMTADEIKKKLTEVYADLLRQPEITVSVREFNAKLAEVQRAIATAPYGQARLISVRPDGHISLPMISDMQAAGRTVPDLIHEINTRYKKLIGDIDVSVLLREVVGNLIFVDGQVSTPGVHNVKGPLTVQHAIALAGGTKDTAEPRTVLVVSRGPDGKFIARTTDLTNLSSATDYYLSQGDLVYVPKSRIARANTWVEQNITKLILFNGWTMGLQGDFGRVSTR
jgi:protein involved in polysaccharide export with SLBB domain